MADFLKARLEALHRSQNADGGWGYFPGKDSWLEPTAYAALALHGQPAGDRAWKLLSSWQGQDGSWRPSERVNVANWGTSLCVTIALARAEFGVPLRQGVAWLLGSAGVETNWLGIWIARLHLSKADRDISLRAWPWKPGNSSWLEPTVHAVVALWQVARAAASVGLDAAANRTLAERARTGEAQLWSVRGRDGGWNYGTPLALGIELPSYPETTALALVGLQGHAGLDPAFGVADAMLAKTPSPLASAWLTIARRLHGVNAPEVAGELSQDNMLTAIEALSAPHGNWKLLQAGGLA